MNPTLVVIAGYLAADIILDGYIAALAVFSLGVGEFLFLLILRGKRHASLILEGAVLAAAGLAGDKLAVLGYRGTGYVLLELILAGVLLVSTARGKPWLSSQMKRFVGFSTDAEFSGKMSLVMGLLFFAHGVFLAVIIVLKGKVLLLPAILSFAVLYSLAIVYIRKHQRSRRVKSAPGLLKGDDGKLVLIFAGRKVGSMMLQPGVAAIVTDVEIALDREAHEFLEILETYLKLNGCRALRFPVWSGDEMTLEMAGYHRTPTGWNKIL